MKKYRRESFDVEAIQLFTDYNFDCSGEVLDAIRAVTEMLHNAGRNAFWIGIDPADKKFKISTYDGVLVVNRADWIVKGSKGELGIVNDEIFKILFEGIGEVKNENKG